MTRVSALVAVYNQEAFVAETLDSVLAQDVDGLELIVSDDASTDATPEILREYERRHPDRVRLLLGEDNQGVTVSCDRLLRAARGEYLAWMGGDDVMLPGKLAAQVADLEAHPEAVMSYHALELFTDASDVGGSVTNQGDPRWRDVSELVAEGNFVLAAGVVHRAAAAPAHGFRTELPFASDWLYFIEVALNGPILFTPGVLGRYRVHPGQMTGDRVGNRQATLHDPLRTLEIVAHEHPPLRGAARQGRAHILFREAMRQRRAGTRKLATWPLLGRAVVADPRHDEAWRALGRDVLGPLAGPLRRGTGRLRRG